MCIKPKPSLIWTCIRSKLKLLISRIAQRIPNFYRCLTFPAEITGRAKTRRAKISIVSTIILFGILNSLFPFSIAQCKQLSS